MTNDKRSKPRRQAPIACQNPELRNSEGFTEQDRLVEFAGRVLLACHKLGGRNRRQLVRAVYQRLPAATELDQLWMIVDDKMSAGHVLYANGCARWNPRRGLVDYQRPFRAYNRS